MVYIKIYDNKEINPCSNILKEKISQSVVSYLLEHWNECISFSNIEENGIYTTELKISL